MVSDCLIEVFSSGFAHGPRLGMSWPLPASDGYGDQSDPFLKAHASQLRQQKREQDDNLTMLGESVSRLGELSLSISKEIESQNEMLDELGDEVDAAKDTADILTKKTADLIKQVGGPKQFCTILILCGILFVLTLLVVYT